MDQFMIEPDDDVWLGEKNIFNVWTRKSLRGEDYTKLKQKNIQNQSFRTKRNVLHLQ